MSKWHAITPRRAGAPQVIAAEQAANAPTRRASSQFSEALIPRQQRADAAAPRWPRLRLPTRSLNNELANEVKDMRRMLEAQLATLAWNDMSRRSPLQAAMLKELAQLGISQSSRRFAGAQDSREPEFLRGASLRARDHRAHGAGHRRPLARSRAAASRSPVRPAPARQR
jgi:hypothetical protein